MSMSATLLNAFSTLWIKITFLLQVHVVEESGDLIGAAFVDAGWC